MLRKVSWPRHLAVGGVIAVSSGMALLGIVGQPRQTERFDAKLVVVAPADPGDTSSDALRITETIDQDFGREQRRGHERFVPNNFGVPTDVTASSETAPDDVRVEQVENDETRIRIGDPNVTVSGQHRYVLGFTLPAARLSSGELALDVIGTDETLETGRFEIVVTGLVLDDPRCNVGGADASGGCTLALDGDVYRAVIEPLAPGDGITIGGTIVGRTDVVTPAEPENPSSRDLPNNRVGLALGMLPLGLATAAGVFAWATRRGRNEVFAGGAADAAFGSLPAPGPDGSIARSSVTLISDRRLGDLATIEFEPPPGLEPWQGAVLIREHLDDAVVSAWFSGLAGHEAVELAEDDKKLVIRSGRHRDRLDPADAALVDELFGGEDTLEIEGYDAHFAAVWAKARERQDQVVRDAGWWHHLTPRNRGGFPGSIGLALASLAALVVAGGMVFLGVVGLIAAVWSALLFGVVLAGATAFLMYQTLLPVRTATGTALTLRTESFRRFLAASEGQHVDWAWERGVVREYSAWAVALGEAKAWGKALEASTVAPQDPTLRSPLLVYSMGSALASARTSPSSSGGGGFSGGSVGGGGGGGRSGSW